MTPDEHHLRDTARALAWLYRLLEARKFDAPPPREARAMRPAPGPQAPVASWITSAEDCLLEERRDEKIPGGLRVMVSDAAAHIQTPIPREGARPTGAELCDYVAWNAHVIALDFPAADDLADLMVQQARWLKRKLNPTANTPKARQSLAYATRRYTAADAAALVTAATGQQVDRKQVNYWGRAGYVSVEPDDAGTATYLLEEVAQAARGRDHPHDVQHSPPTC